jgi:hypothetical protein
MLDDGSILAREYKQWFAIPPLVIIILILIFSSASIIDWYQNRRNEQVEFYDVICASSIDTLKRLYLQGHRVYKDLIENNPALRMYLKHEEKELKRILG